MIVLRRHQREAGARSSACAAACGDRAPRLGIGKGREEQSHDEALNEGSAMQHRASARRTVLRRTVSRSPRNRRRCGASEHLAARAAPPSQPYRSHRLAGHGAAGTRDTGHRHRHAPRRRAAGRPAPWPGNGAADRACRFRAPSGHPEPSHLGLIAVGHEALQSNHCELPARRSTPWQSSPPVHDSAVRDPLALARKSCRPDARGRGARVLDPSLVHRRAPCRDPQSRSARASQFAT